MTVLEWVGVAVGVMTICASFAGAVRWLVKGFLNELKPNGGSSLKDSVSRLEEKVEILYQILLQRGKD